MEIRGFVTEKLLNGRGTTFFTVRVGKMGPGLIVTSLKGPEAT